MVENRKLFLLLVCLASLCCGSCSQNFTNVLSVRKIDFTGIDELMRWASGNEDEGPIITNITRHRASTSMYSLTFCVRVMLPERHHWKPAVLRRPGLRASNGAAAVMLRTSPVDGQSPTSQPRPLAIYGAQF